MRTLIIDNYDSFTFNLFQMLAEVIGEAPDVVRNDQVTWHDIERRAPRAVVISPGPGRPENARDFGICGDVVRRAGVPILGVCLGHQGIACAFGGRTVHAPEVMHGRLSTIVHGGDPLFASIPRRFEAVRYHSLLVPTPLPAALAEIAWTSGGLLMGLRHRQRPIWGVQFHPESICTQFGSQLLRNFCDLALAFRDPSAAGASAAVP